jgi:heavy metal sensor kinase
MFFARILKLRHTLAFRLTLWYAGIFTLSSLAAFSVFYFSLSTITRQHTDQELSNELSEFSFLLKSKGMDAVKANMDLEAQSNGVENTFFRVVTTDGKELASSNMAPWEDIGAGTTALKQLNDGAGRVFETLTVPENNHDVRAAYGAIGPGTIMQIGQSLKDDEEFLEITRDIFGVTLTAFIVVAGLIGWFMARRALRGVEEVTHTAVEISKGALETRVPVKARGDEIDRLATAFNSMLDRIRGLITGMREMTDNIAHDLRSPITRIRGIAELALTGAGRPEEYETMAASTIEECDRLLEMINTMLDITEVESGVGRLVMEKIDLSALVQDACELFQPLADDKGITLAAHVPAGVLVPGDIQRLQRMAANLLDNAIKYTAPGGRVSVAVKGDAGTAVVTIIDTGIGIPEKDQSRIFDRFYRGDRSRSQTGTGLGLSLARAIASAHNGVITVASAPGAGSTFTVTLPLLPGSR